MYAIRSYYGDVFLRNGKAQGNGVDEGKGRLYGGRERVYDGIQLFVRPRGLGYQGV